MNYQIREMTFGDWEQVKEVYIEGIKTEIATFETAVPSWDKWNSDHLATCRLVASYEDRILGWVALSPVSSRSAYAGVAEVSIYISKQYWGNGIGQGLMTRLIHCSEENGFWTLQVNILQENTASLSLYKKCGFREVGRREKMGRMKNGAWLDTFLLERRSSTVGID